MNVLKIIGWALLVVFTVLTVLAGIFLFTRGFYELSVTLFVLIFLIDFFILNKNAYPYRYMIPALILLFILVIYPIAFTIRTAFTNYGTGHISTKQEVVERLLVDPIYTYVVENGRELSYALYLRYEGAQPTRDFVLLVTDKSTGEVYVARSYKVLKSEAGQLILGESDLVKASESDLLLSYERKSGSEQPPAYQAPETEKKSDAGEQSPSESSAAPATEESESVTATGVPSDGVSPVSEEGAPEDEQFVESSETENSEGDVEEAMSLGTDEGSEEQSVHGTYAEVPRFDFITTKDRSVVYKYFFSPEDPETSINDDFFRYQVLYPILSKVEFVDAFQNRYAIRQDEEGKFKLVQINHLYKLGLAEVIERGKSIVKVVLINTKTGKPLVEENGTFYDTNEKGEKFAVAGYISNYGFKNFSRIFTDPTVSGPFAKVFVWNFTWAALSVLFTFVIGLSLALVLNNPNLRGRAIYRSLLIIPWAIPAFISVLVWKNGFFNETYGILNKFIVTGLLGREPIKWFNDPFWAKVAVLTVNTWLGFPYMMVVSLGALQSIPEDYYEAAAIDGATKWQRFWKITFPLLMTTIAPLLVGSFAFNFNNFVNIYLLTGGGPAMPNTTTPAGSTDILISYTYKLAFEGGRGQDFGFASAISIMIFFIVGGISFINFKLSGSFEEVSR